LPLLKSLATISLLAIFLIALPSEGLAQKKKKTGELNLKEELTPYQRANSEYMLIEAQKFFLLEDYKRSIAFLEKALEVDEENHAAHFKMAEVNLILGDHTAGLAAIDKAIELQQDNKYYYVLGAQLQKASQNYAGAAQYYDLMLSNATNCNTYLIEVTQVYEKLNELDKAIDILDQAEVSGLSLDQKSRKVDLLLKAEKDKDAINYLASLFRENPNNTQIFYKYAFTLSENDRVTESIALLEENERTHFTASGKLSARWVYRKTKRIDPHCAWRP